MGSLCIWCSDHNSGCHQMWFLHLGLLSLPAESVSARKDIKSLLSSSATFSIRSYLCPLCERTTQSRHIRQEHVLQ